jgi:hypothetical protein
LSYGPEESSRSVNLHNTPVPVEAHSGFLLCERLV